MIVVGLTGGIASGKSTILDFIKKQNIPVHDSDKCVRKIYKSPTTKFLTFLRSIGLGNAIKRNKIDKNIIREEVFNNHKKLKNLEKQIHKNVKKTRDEFLKKQKKLRKKIVVLDIPLLFENKLEKICDYVFLAHCSYKKRKLRALKRNNMNIKILKKIIKLQTPNKTKLTKSDFIFNTSLSRSYNNKQITKVLKKIKFLNDL